MDTFNVVKLVLSCVFLALMIIIGMGNSEPFYMVIFAVISSFGLIYGVGLLPYSFLVFIILAITLMTYVQSGSIEDTLLNLLLVFTLSIILGFFGDIDVFKPFK